MGLSEGKNTTISGAERPLVHHVAAFAFAFDGLMARQTTEAGSGQVPRLEERAEQWVVRLWVIVPDGVLIPHGRVPVACPTFCRLHRFLGSIETAQLTQARRSLIARHLHEPLLW